MCDTVAVQLVGHEQHGFLSLTLQQSAEESPRRTPVRSGRPVSLLTASGAGRLCDEESFVGSAVLGYI